MLYLRRKIKTVPIGKNFTFLDFLNKLRWSLTRPTKESRLRFIQKRIAKKCLFTCCWMTSEYRQLSVKDTTECSIERSLSYREWNNMAVHSPSTTPHPQRPSFFFVTQSWQKLSRLSGARMTGVCYKRGHCSNKKHMTHLYSSLGLL